MTWQSATLAEFCSVKHGYAFEGAFFAVVKTELYRHIFEISTSASVDRRGSLRWKDFAKIPLWLPALEEQAAIVDVLSAVTAHLEVFRHQLHLLREQKKGLLQKLLTGKIPVKV